MRFSLEILEECLEGELAATPEEIEGVIARTEDILKRLHERRLEELARRQEIVDSTEH